MAIFATIDAVRASCLSMPSGNQAAGAAVRQRQATLTKPPGSLGRLETLTEWLAVWQNRALPRLGKVDVLVFAGNHGVVQQRVSALSRVGHRADGRKLFARWCGHQPACRGGRRVPASHADRTGSADEGFHHRTGYGRRRVPARRDRGLRRRAHNKRPAVPGRNGHRQHNRRGRSGGSPVRRRWRDLGGPRNGRGR